MIEETSEKEEGRPATVSDPASLKTHDSKIPITYRDVESWNHLLAMPRCFGDRVMVTTETADNPFHELTMLNTFSKPVDEPNED